MTGSRSLRATYLDALRMLLRPFVRFCLRRSISIQDFFRVAKGVFIELAVEELSKTAESVNVSRIAVFTGIHRNEVARIYAKKEPIRDEPATILGRVIGQWRHDKRFVTKSGEPRTLKYRGRKSEFRKLVETVSKNINPGTVLLELERIQAVERTTETVELLREMAGFALDPLQSYQLLSDDIDTLVSSAEENVIGMHDVSNLHMRTEYDSIDTHHLPEIRQWLIDQGKTFHRSAREYLSQYDLDITPGVAKGKRNGRVIVGTFGWTSPSKNEVGG